MIEIYKSETELGFSILDLNTEEFQYGEVCDSNRLIAIVNSFPEHEVIIYVERAWQEDLQDIFFLMPHLQDLATVKTERKVSVKQMISQASKPKVRSSYISIYAFLGIIIGSLFLIPISTEYKSSVLVQAQSIEKVTHDFAKNQPNKQTRKELYTSLDKLNQKVRIDAVTYSSGKYKVVFSSGNGKLKLKDLGKFKKAKLNPATSLGSEQGVRVYIYELEGNL